MTLVAKNNDSLPQLFSTKIKVLVIHHDTILLDQIQQMCDPCHYLITKCTSPSYALNLLVERYGYFDMMLIDVGMPNIDSYEFVQYVTLEHKIPVIVISSDATKHSVMNSIIHGACDYWIQPLHEKQFKTMWQHVARKALIQNKEIVEFLEAQSEKEAGVLGFLEIESRKEDEAPGHEREDDKSGKEKSAKKSRLSWTPQLHQQFVNAVTRLGPDDVKPSKILKIMDVSGLTTAQVASHLQKYRDHLKRPSGGKKSKKSPTECINKTALETHQHGNSTLEDDQTCQLNSTIQSDHNCEAQQHSIECQVYNIIGNNYETKEHSVDVGVYQVSDIMSDDPSDMYIDLDELMSLLDE